MGIEHGGKAPEERFKEPQIQRVGDVSIVGVNHLAAFSDTQGPSKNVLKIVENADRLLIEGGKDSFLKNNYESVSADKFKERGKEADIYTLEDDVDFATLAQDHGLDADEYRKFITYRFVHGTFEQFLLDNDTSELPAFKEVLGNVMANSVGAQSELPKEDIDHILNVDIKLLQEGDIKTRNALIYASYRMDNGFHTKVRDHDVLYPRIKELDDTTPGEKVVIVGELHAIPLKEALENGRMDDPPTWKEFQKGLDAAEKHAFDTFEKVITGKKTKPWYRFGR